jgi:hypothetical protein
MIRNLQVGGHIALDLSYQDGKLAGAEYLRLYIRLNYNDGARDAVFPMTKEGGRHFVRVTNGCLVGGEAGRCLQGSSDVMRNLLIWATRIPYTLNQLSLEVAVVDEAGRWDSIDGENYKFVFPEHRM